MGPTRSIVLAVALVACGDDDAASTSTSTGATSSGATSSASTSSSVASSASSGAGGAGGGLDLDLPTDDEVAVAAALAAKDCEALERCVPRTFALTYADRAECEAKGATFWAALMFGPDSGATLESVAACGADLDLVTCEDWWAFNYGAGAGACKRTGLSKCANWVVSAYGAGPESCFPRGARANGDPCGHGVQCASGACLHDQNPGVGCSVCVPTESVVGGHCGDGGHCGGGLVCQGTACAELGRYGGACPCLPSLVCFAGCREPHEVGESCDSGQVEVNAGCAADLVCSDDVCEEMRVVEVGERCGALSDGTTARCARGSACKIAEEPNLATCVPWLAPGDPCTTGYHFGSGCEPPFTCVDGICALHGPRICP